MIGLIGVFTRHFSPTEGGYLYYPDPQSGGKLVTIDEYAKLVADWQKVVGPRGLLKIFGLVLASVLLLAIAAGFYTLPRWTASVLPWIFMISIWGWIMWAGAAPGRLVKDRPTTAPPRPRSGVEPPRPPR